ncbi:unnamed protein product [Caenorhabditis angaria]|uniref:Cation efflux protein transmembrane domain-containing protein n=1 Tax=Caenorhabditis angaria TaxID=860376 RepID=A0A9P1J263_9PELO|nr:unnamed protein product [Caenorhabditis angaria]
MDEEAERQTLGLKNIKKNKWMKLTFAIFAITNVANFSLVVIKTAAAYLSGSFSIGTSAIESFGDVFVSCIILTQYVLDKKVKTTSYPRGKVSETTTNLVSAIVMITLATVNWVLSAEALVTGSLKPEFGFIQILVIIVNIVVKILLFFLCNLKKDNYQVYVLMRDQLTDVVTNSVALVAVFFSHYFWIPSDFVGSQIIYAVILTNWLPVVYSSWFDIQGAIGAKTDYERVEKVVSENLNRIEKFSGLLIYHLGNKIIVEVFADITSPADQIILTDLIDELEDVHKSYIIPAEKSIGNSAVKLVELELLN